ncbi:DUF11 domain-containing protein [Leucobacter viscericola]|uniref:DUF11 domain-containing protein n=1 Tax=Leucobacter viscericola TaxID=2714935 RepID=A0A6G7XFE7_9MICO|nr:SdrD B-like domain-containing protein [Leucobacter viscericola]QIK63285.1 DUF11 domain-containing protein [Leucobacter viscericola]
MYTPLIAARPRGRKSMRTLLLAIVAVLVVPLLVLGGSAHSAFAAPGNDGMLSTALVAKNTTVYSGDSLVYEAQLSCSDPAQCKDVTLRFSKPVGATGAATVVKPYPPGVTSVVANANGTVDVVYAATEAGLVSQLTISWPTENYTTMPGDQTTVMTVSQPGKADVTRSATIELLAASELQLTKRGAPQTRPNENYTYSLSADITHLDPASDHGAIGYHDLTLVDTLPAEATFVSATAGGTYNAASHTVTWTLDNLFGHADASVTVTFPASATGKTIINTATLTGTPNGSPKPETKTAQSPVVVADTPPDYRVTASKTGTSISRGGGQQRFEIVATNWGNLTQDITVTDPIPDGLNVTVVDRGPEWRNVHPGSTVEFTYADGTSSGPLDFNVDRVEVPAGAPRVTKVTVKFVGVRVEESFSVAIWSDGDWDALANVTEITNCATVKTAGASNQVRPCATIEVSQVPTPKPAIYKDASQTPVGPGGTITWTLQLQNNDLNTPWMPLVYDDIPNELSYQTGSFRALASNKSYCPAASEFSEEVLNNWNQAHGTPFTSGPRSETVKWTYTGTKGILIPSLNTNCKYQYDTVVNPGAVSGSYTGEATEPSYRGNLATAFDRDVRVPNDSNDWSADLYDADGDGDTKEYAPRAGGAFTLADTAATWIEKHVTGDQDNGKWFDSAEVPGQSNQVGTSTPGGTVSYSVKMGNFGNRDLKDLVAYDLLPYPGNHGVTNGRYAQDPPGNGNEWVPTMTGPIAVTDPSMTITYSTKTDPCRPEMDNSDDHSASFYCAGAQDTSWQTAAGVTDWSAIRSIRFDFGERVFKGGEFVDAQWTMATPTTLADGSPIVGGERTWNRIALDSVQAKDGSPMLAAEAPWVVDQMAEPTEPAMSVEKWSTDDGFPAGDFDTAPGKTVTIGSATPITMTVTNTGAEALRDVTVSDVTLNGPAMTGLSCDFSKLGGPSTGVAWGGPFVVGASFECTGTVPALKSAQTHGDSVSVAGVGVSSGTRVSDEDPWYAVAATTYAIGDYTWVDANKNGVQDKGEDPLAGVSVILYGSDGTELARTTTDKNGYYHFDNLAAGDYTVEFGAVDGYDRTVALAGSDATVDSDADVATGRTAVIHLGEGETNVTPSVASDKVDAPFINRTIDAGYVKIPAPVDEIGRVKIVKDDGRTLVKPGETLNYVLEVTNYTKYTAPDVVVRDVLPDNLTFVRSSIPGTVSFDNPYGFEWSLGDMAPGQVKKITITVTVNKGLLGGTKIVNTATVTSDGTCKDDPSMPGDECSSTDIDHTPEGLWVLKDDHRTEVKAGDTLTYDVTIGNDSVNTVVKNAIVTDILPKNVSFVSASDGGKLSAEGSAVVWRVSSLAAGANKVVHVTVKVSEQARAGDKVVNSVVVKAPGRCEDDNDTCTSTDTDRVVWATDLALTGFESAAALTGVGLLLAGLGAVLVLRRRSQQHPARN